MTHQKRCTCGGVRSPKSKHSAPDSGWRHPHRLQVLWPTKHVLNVGQPTIWFEIVLKKTASRSQEPDPTADACDDPPTQEACNDNNRTQDEPIEHRAPTNEQDNSNAMEAEPSPENPSVSLP